MTLRLLRLNSLIRRLAHSNRYVLSADGIRIAIFCTKVNNGSWPRSPQLTGHRHSELRATLAAISRNHSLGAPKSGRRDLRATSACVALNAGAANRSVPIK
jgi:hypothetical protein